MFQVVWPGVGWSATRNATTTTATVRVAAALLWHDCYRLLSSNLPIIVSRFLNCFIIRAGALLLPGRRHNNTNNNNNTNINSNGTMTSNNTCNNNSNSNIIRRSDNNSINIRQPSGLPQHHCYRANCCRAGGRVTTCCHFSQPLTTDIAMIIVNLTVTVGSWGGD